VSPAAADNVIEFPAQPGTRKPPGLKPKTRARRIVALGGGKGGIGKTLVSANLGIALAQRGKRVVLVDADLGGANLHTCLGLPQPAATLSDFVSKKV
jgi:flagellar biosynthesis protein FlhG